MKAPTNTIGDMNEHALSSDAGVPRRPLPDAVVEQLAELWCEALLANLRRHPIPHPLSRAS